MTAKFLSQQASRGSRNVRARRLATLCPAWRAGSIGETPQNTSSMSEMGGLGVTPGQYIQGLFLIDPTAV